MAPADDDDFETVAATTAAAAAATTAAATTAAATTAAATTAAVTTAAPSDGPSDGPSNRLLEELIEGRYLQNASDDGNVTTTTSSAEEECVCPPEVMTTFTTTLTFSDTAELLTVDFGAVRDALVTAGGYPETATIEATATIKVSMSYTFEGDTPLTADECKTAVADAYTVDAANVMCAEGAAVAAANVTTTAAAAAATTTAAASRRLSPVVMDVEISFTTEQAQEAVDASSTVPTLSLLPAGQTQTDSTTAVVTVDITLEVTSDMEVEPPSSSSVQEQLGLIDITATASVGEAVPTYILMPCSASETVCAAGWDMRSENLACAGAECTDDDRETCCTQQVTTTAGAQGTCMLGSLTVLALSCNFVF